MKLKQKIRHPRLVFVILMIALFAVFLLYYFFVFSGMFARNQFTNEMVEISEQNEKSILPLWNRIFDHADRVLTKQIRQLRPKQPYIKTPVKPTEAVPPPQLDELIEGNAKLAAIIVVPFTILALVCLSKYALAILVLSAIIYAFVFIKFKNHAKNYIAEQKYKYSVYKEAKDQYDRLTESNKQLLTEYENTRKQVDHDVLQAHTALMQKYETAISASLAQNEAQLKQAQATLEQLYAMNILHPKYRNFIAVTMLLEYFETERCDALTGPNGAYNLYEAELRQNLIILKLDEIIDRIDELQSTMYNCCEAMRTLNKQMNKVQQQLGSISVKMDQQLTLQQQTLQFSAATAMYSAATAANTEALKYISLVS